MRRHHVTIVCADYDPGRQHGELTWREYESLPVVEIANNWICASFADTYLPPLVSARLRHVLHIVQPHVVHVHNLLNLSFDLPAAARERGIPVVATLHDFTLVCPSGGQRIHQADSHVCHTIDAARCARCFKESPFYSQAAAGSPAAVAATSGVGRRALALVRRLPPGMIQGGARAMAHVRGFPVTEADMRERLTKAQSSLTMLTCSSHRRPLLARRSWRSVWIDRSCASPTAHARHGPVCSRAEKSHRCR